MLRAVLRGTNDEHVEAVVAGGPCGADYGTEGGPGGVELPEWGGWKGETSRTGPDVRAVSDIQLGTEAVPAVSEAPVGVRVLGAGSGVDPEAVRERMLGADVRSWSETGMGVTEGISVPDSRAASLSNPHVY